MPTARKLATIDIGTNTLLLLVVEERAGTLQPIHEECRFGRLGQGLDRTGNLAEAAVARSLAILRDYREIADRLGATPIRAVGTQALREAGNSESFLAPAHEILGAAVTVISGEREAELVYRAVAESFPDLARAPLVVADVGGGSTEIILGAGGAPRARHSLKIGSVRLAERLLPSDPPTPAETTRNTKPRLLSFSKDHCLPCEIMAPWIDMIKKQYGAKIDVRDVNLDRQMHQATGRSLKVKTIPPRSTWTRKVVSSDDMLDWRRKKR